MAYQKCPKCGGTGKRFNAIPLTGNPWADMSIVGHNGLISISEAKGMDNTCPVCKGKMIISETTGKPPKY